jgi:predicted helicase
MASSLNLKNGTSDALPQGLMPEDIFSYIYAVFHSPGYRSRYAEFLKIDFPRIPLTGSLELFRSLARLGDELVDLHLLEVTDLSRQTTRFAGRGSLEVEKGYPKFTNGKVMVSLDRWFEDVPKDVWEFHIGGYQVCEKWLKDRRGRTLSEKDIEHYQKVIVAISETIRLMSEIDKVIDAHGGWPRAFVTN